MKRKEQACNSRRATSHRRRLPAKLMVGVLLAGFVTTPAFAAPEERILLDGSSGWEPVRTMSNVSFVVGHRGLPELQLADRTYPVDADTDLLLSFEPRANGDRAGNYAVQRQVDQVGQRARVGEGAAAFSASGGGLVLEPRAGTLLAPGSSPGDFSIEFWLFPVSAGDGEIVLRWEGILGDLVSGRPQSLRVEVQNRRLEWTFENIFQTPEAERFTVNLAGRDLLVPRHWQHHLLRYRADIGLIEYLVDGRVQDVTHATSSGGEEGDTFVPLIGARSPRRLEIGPAFRGLMDEVRFSRRFVTEPNLTPETPEPGHIVFGPIDLGQAGSLLSSVSGSVQVPGQSDVRLYYRIADSDLMGDGEWVHFERSQRIIPPATGRYVWLRAELYPGEPGDPSPQLRRLEVVYEPNDPPPPPRGVVATPGDGQVALSWNEVRGDNVQGYRVYYGTRSGEYLGTVASQGASPIDVGRETAVTIRGLKNGLLYYFAVAAYDESMGSLLYSREVVARPTRTR